MEIVLEEGQYNVLENGNIVYSAQTEEEALGFIEWINREDAGSNAGCENC